MEMPFTVISLSHKSAPVDIRELIYLPEETCRELLVRFKEMLGIEEALIFSTCNRTEVYYISEQDLSHEIIKILCASKGINKSQKYSPYFQIIKEEGAAVRYLFEVSMGLHSHVLGDLQISNQIKKAYIWANEASMAGAYMHRLLHTIFHANKRVHQETPYRDGAASVSYAAAELATELTPHLQEPKVLVLGLGEMGRDVALNLDGEHFEEIAFMNRTFAKAENLAFQAGAKAIPLSELKSQIGYYDVIISAVSVDTPLITVDLIDAHQAMRSQFVIDLCVPRSVAKEVESLPQVVLFNVDDINSRTAKVLARRQAAIPQVHQIIEEEVVSFLEWRTQLSISPTIQRLKEALEQIRKEELARYFKRASESEIMLLDRVTRGMVNKILKLPVLQLKEACKRGNPEELIEALNDIFNLEQVRIQK